MSLDIISALFIGYCVSRYMALKQHFLSVLSLLSSFFCCFYQLGWQSLVSSLVSIISQLDIVKSCSLNVPILLAV